MAGVPGAEYYFEVNADDLISEAQDATTVGFTPTTWLSHNTRSAERRAKIDDHHNHTPIGEVVSTGLSRDLETSKITMANAGCVIKQDSQRAMDYAKKVANKEITHVSVEYDTHKDPYTGRKVATDLTWISLHTNPYNKRAVITRRQGDNGETIEVESRPARIVLASNPSSQGTKNSIRLSFFRYPPPSTAVMADSSVVVPPAPSTQAPPPGPAPVVPPAAAPGAVPPPANNSAPNAPPLQPPAAASTPAGLTDAEMADIRVHLENARKLSHDKLVVEAAQSARMKAEYEELVKFRSQVQAEKEAAAKQEYETRKNQFMAQKEQLKAVGWDLDKKEIMEAFDPYLRAPTDTKNAWAVVAIQQAKEHVERVAKEAADAQTKAREAQEREMLASKWGQGVLDKIPKRPATETSVSASTLARTAPAQAAVPAENPTVSAQQQLLGVGASQLNGLNRDPVLQQLLGTTTHELLARAKQLANAHHEAVLQETQTGSLPAKALTHLWRQQRTDAPLTTKQGADGGAFTGTPLTGIAASSAEVSIGQIADDLERTGRYKDMCAAAVLKCDGKTFRNPVTGIEFPMEELLSTGAYEGHQQTFSPYAIAQNLLSVGSGMDIPWDNRTRVEDYNRPKAARR